MKDFIAAAEGDRKEGEPPAVSFYCPVLSKFNSCQLSKANLIFTGQAIKWNLELRRIK